MVFKLIGAPTSWNSLRARHILFEKGLEDEVEQVDLNVANGDQKVCSATYYTEERGFSDS